jgi:hypothetical protein
VAGGLEGFCAPFRVLRLTTAGGVLGGVVRQGLMTMDRRFRIPAYLRPNDWIALDVSKGFDIEELQSLALESYRHFALKRMLNALADVVAAPERELKARTNSKATATTKAKSRGRRD